MTNGLLYLANENIPIGRGYYTKCLSESAREQTAAFPARKQRANSI
jgi:hypothetical protein